MNMKFKIFLTLLSLVTNCFSCQIIYLNGTSSVGKTTLAKALQEEFEEPYLLISIDQIIYMMPEKTNNWESESTVSGFC